MCGVCVVVYVWWCMCCGVCVAVYVWCMCGGVCVVYVWWCMCGVVCVVVYVWWCMCGGVCVVLWYVWFSLTKYLFASLVLFCMLAIYLSRYEAHLLHVYLYVRWLWRMHGVVYAWFRV